MGELVYPYAYYIKGDEVQLLSVYDAYDRIEEGIVLRGHLFEQTAYDLHGELVPLKFVNSTHVSAHFAKVPKPKRGSQPVVNSVDYSTKLHEMAKNIFKKVDFDKISLGKFNLTKEYVTDVLIEEPLQFKDEEMGKTITLIPDIILKTPFFSFIIEITVSHNLKKDKLESYKKYYDSGCYDLPFEVVEISLKDLQKVVKEQGYNAVKDEVYRRIIENCDRKKVYVPLEDTPFGRSVRTGNKWQLIINTYADGVSPQLRQVLAKRPDWFNIRSIDLDGLHSLYLTDDSAETPLYPLHCAYHNEEPLHLAMQTAIGRKSPLVYIKCALNESSKSVAIGDVSQCDFTFTLCDSECKLEDEYLVIDGVVNLMSYRGGAKDELFDRIRMLRSCSSAFKLL